MVGENGSPETPDWQPSVHHATDEVVRAIAAREAVRWATLLDRLQAAEDAENIERGTN